MPPTEYLSADELLAGAALTHDIEIPAAVLGPAALSDTMVRKVRMRPLAVRDLQRVTKAARDDDSLLSVLMLKEAMVEPSLSFDQVHGLHAGLARFLVQEVNRISGLAVDDDTLAGAIEAPLARACFVLAREFGWSPQEVGELTMGQIVLYLEMLGQGRRAEAP
jgi:hypothetical protein